MNPEIPVMNIKSIAVGIRRSIKKFAGKDTRERTPVR